MQYYDFLSFFVVVTLILLSVIITVNCRGISKHADSKAIDDLLFLVKKNLNELSELSNHKRSAPDADNQETCVKQCREAFRKSLNYRNIDKQKSGADVFVKCFPACFFPSNPASQNPAECQHSCVEGFNGCYVKADSVEAFTCVLGNDQCESKCNDVRDSTKKRMVYSGSNRCLDGCGISFASCIGLETKISDEKYSRCEQIEQQCNRQCTKTRFL